MKKFSSALRFIYFLLFFFVTAAAQAKGRPPNIVVIVADDLGYADLGIQGSKDIATPNIDALARSGVRFTDAYVSSPLCSPARSGLLTGRYQQRYGHEFNILASYPPHADVGLPLSETTMADRLKAAGYATTLVGKWHLGAASRFHPMARGFDEFFGFLHGAHDYIRSAQPGARPAEGGTGEDGPDNPIYDGRSVVEEPRYLTDALGARAVDYVHRNRARPFFLYLSFNAPHGPVQAPAKYLDRVAPSSDERRRTYAAMVQAMDDAVGQTMAALREEQLEEDTLIFFLSDNGGPTTVGGVNGAVNAPLRGSKFTMWEGGIRVPFVMRWKGHLPAGRVSAQPILQLDILPTALAAAGIERGGDASFDGVNLLPFISGDGKQHPHGVLYWRLGGMMAIRRGNWKLVRMPENGQEGAVLAPGDYSGLELYDLEKDLGETDNLAAKFPARVKELAVEWQRWARQMAAPAWAPRPKKRPLNPAP